MADVTIAGRKFPRWMVITTVAGGAAVTGYILWQRHESAAAAAAPAAASSSGTATVTDPSTGAVYPADGTDPVTGLTYGQEISEYGSVEAAEQAAGDVSDDYAPDEGYYGYGDDTGDETPPVTYGNNTAWAQAAESGLSEIGYSETDVAEALGLWFAGKPLTSSEAAICYAAEAEYGDPPDGAPPIVLATTSSGGVTVPDVTGVDVEQATQILDAAGLKASGPAGVKGVTHVVTGTTPKAETKVASGTTVTLAYKSVKS